MSRRRASERRLVPPDSRYDSVELARFINKIMKCGKKTVAQRLTYAALEMVREETRREPLDVFSQALKNTIPMLEVKPRRVGGATYQIPTEVRPERQVALGMRWIVLSARARKGRPMFEGLAQELLEASRGQGASVKRREDLYRMAEANRAFVHYRW